MVTVVNNTITLVRGDTVEIPVTIRTRDGEKYIPSEGDVVRFALKDGDGDDGRQYCRSGKVLIIFL